MLNLYNGNVLTSNRKLQSLLETKLSSDEKVPKTGRVLRNKIFVIGFPPNCTETDLESFFSNFGLVRETRIVKDDNGITKGYAFITYVKERSVVHALEYRGPLYFMDRKLSINPAIKKQHQLFQPDRCLSFSTSVNTSSEKSATSNNIPGACSLTTTPVFPMMSIQLSSQPNEATIRHFPNTASQPYFHLSFPSHPMYCSSGSNPLWYHYFSASTSYPSYLPMSHTGDELYNIGVYHNSMMRYTPLLPNNKNFH